MRNRHIDYLHCSLAACLDCQQPPRAANDYPGYWILTLEEFADPIECRQILLQEIEEEELIGWLKETYFAFVRGDMEHATYRV